MAKKDNREIWENLFQEGLNDTQSPDDSSQQKSGNEAAILFGIIFSGLIAVAFLVMLIICSVTGDSSNNIAGCCIMLVGSTIFFVLCLVAHYSDKVKEKHTKDQDESQQDKD